MKKLSKYQKRKIGDFCCGLKVIYEFNVLIKYENLLIVEFGFFGFLKTLNFHVYTCVVEP